MAEKKIRKTARASMGDKGVSGARACPQCGQVMAVTKVMKSEIGPGGMYWICPKGDFRGKVGTF